MAWVLVKLLGFQRRELERRHAWLRLKTKQQQQEQQQPQQQERQECGAAQAPVINSWEDLGE